MSIHLGSEIKGTGQLGRFGRPELQCVVVRAREERGSIEWIETDMSNPKSVSIPNRTCRSSIACTSDIRDGSVDITGRVAWIPLFFEIPQPESCVRAAGDKTGFEKGYG